MRIRNILLQEACEKFNLSQPTNLSDYEMIIFGTNSTGEKQMIKFRILGCLEKPFLGPHYVSIDNQEPFWVISLTALKRKFFDFVDKLSFERSFLLPMSESDYIRLKNIRCICTINPAKVLPETFVKVYVNPYHSVDIYVSKEGRYVQFPVTTTVNEEKEEIPAQGPPSKKLKIHSRSRIGPHKLKKQNLKMCQQLLNAYSRVYPEKLLHEISEKILEDVKTNLDYCISTDFDTFYSTHQHNEIFQACVELVTKYCGERDEIL